MKLRALGALAVTLALAFITPAHAELNRTDRSLVLVTTGSIIVATLCPGFDILKGANKKQAEINGADFDGLAPVIGAAMAAQLGQDYDSSLLIPEVTRTVRSFFLEMDVDFDRNKARACKKWSDVLLPAGVLTRK
ncbi:hypothetical protein [Bradyrhizobium sp. SZCCHNS3053]|uniref:hypothetical protein n=1 Tax=Bradyrhizobium sp. SZCCHNS3053 TaxID=3057322 RepID=UPI002915E4D2|nr:hypothetical protein [Bradyrhizobium sp. SZCCHNS3053]